GGQAIDSNGDAIGDLKGLPRYEMCKLTSGAIRNGAGAVSVNLRPIGRERILERLPQTYELVRAVAELDVTKEPVPIRPAAHRPIGGIQATGDGETALTGLFGVGECACPGLNGADRLAGNPLTEALVFGRRAGEAAARYAREASGAGLPQSRVSDEENRIVALTGDGSSDDSLGKIQSELRPLMDDKVGFVRDGSGLEDAISRIRSLKDRHGRIKVKNPSRSYNYELTTYFEVGSMLNVAEVVALAAQFRTESRGAHRRAGF